MKNVKLTLASATHHTCRILIVVDNSIDEDELKQCLITYCFCTDNPNIMQMKAHLKSNGFMTKSIIWVKHWQRVGRNAYFQFITDSLEEGILCWEKHSSLLKKIA